MYLFYLSWLRKMTLLRGYIYFFFTFLFLRVYVPTENHTVESLGNFSRTTLQSCLWRSGYSLCPTGRDTQLDSNVTDMKEEIDGLPALSLVVVGVEFLEYCAGRGGESAPPWMQQVGLLRLTAFCRGAYLRPSSPREG